KLVNDGLGHRDCCPTAQAPADCLNQGGWPPLAQNKFVFMPTQNAALSADQVVEELGSNKRPFIFSWFNSDKKTGHLMVAVDYKTVDGKDVVVVDDPITAEFG